MYILTCHVFAYLFSDARHSRALENEKTLVFSRPDNITPEQSGEFGVVVSLKMQSKSKYIPAKYDTSSTESESDSEIWAEFRAIGAVRAPIPLGIFLSLNIL